MMAVMIAAAVGWVVSRRDSVAAIAWMAIEAMLSAQARRHWTTRSAGVSCGRTRPSVSCLATASARHAVGSGRVGSTPLGGEEVLQRRQPRKGRVEDRIAGFVDGAEGE